VKVLNRSGTESLEPFPHPSFIRCGRSILYNDKRQPAIHVLVEKEKRMKRTPLAAVGWIAVLSLAACSPLEFSSYPGTGTESVFATVTETPSETRTADSTQENADLSTEMKLLIGTFRLEGTSLEVTAAQAKVLAPLWMTMKTTQANMLVTVEDIQAVTARIQAAMTPEQLQAINDMNLTSQSLTDLLQKLNLSFGRSGDYDHDGDYGQQAPDVTPAPDGTPLFPGGGGMQRFAHMIPRGLLDALVQDLQAIQ
jgi:hypothetical protein